MTAKDEAAQAALGDVRYVLLDFDGPICDIFAGLPAPDVAAKLRKMLETAGVELPGDVQAQDDPIEVFRYSAALSEELNLMIWRALAELEVKAAGTAVITPGVEDVLRHAVDSGRPVAVVSNNSVAGVTAFLDARGLLAEIRYISARADADPNLLKPNTYLVRQALDKLGADPERTIMVGDSLSDIEAAKAAGVISVGYANKPGKAARFTSAGADLVVEHMADLVPVL